MKTTNRRGTTRRSLLALALASLVAFAFACSSENQAPGDGGTATPCPSGKGPRMVRIPNGQGGTMCIDSTEVTRAQYSQFLSDSSARSLSRRSFCSTAQNADTPDATCMAEPHVCKGGCESHPQVCVAWCSATAFCAWAGKKLCGAGPWLNACGGGLETASGAPGPSAKSRYPYGDTLDDTACNGGRHPQTGCGAAPSTCGTVPAGSLSRCQGIGSYAGVFDMSGNVYEWVDSVTEQNRAAFGGGAFSVAFGPDTDAECALAGSSEPLLGVDNIGFRCCAD